MLTVRSFISFCPLQNFVLIVKILLTCIKVFVHANHHLRFEIKY